MEAEMKRIAKEKASKAGGAMTSASAEVDELSKELVKHTAAWTHKKDAVKAEKKNVEKFQKQAKKHEEATAKEAERLDRLAADAKTRAEALEVAETAAEKAEIVLQGVQSGSGAGGDGDKSLQTQLTEANASVANAAAAAKNAALTAKHCEKELVGAKKLFAAKEKEGAKLAKDLASAEATYANAKAALEAAEVEHEVVSYYGVGHAFWKNMAQIRAEQMPQLAAWRLSTNFLRNFYSGRESFARKRAFLEFMLAEQKTDTAVDGEGIE